MLSRHGGQVVTIEAVPGIAAHLKASIEANQLDNVALYPYAVGSPDTEDSVKIQLDPYNKGGSSVIGNQPEINESENQVYDVGLTTIDSILDSNPALEKLMAMKMDIEGNEGKALKGAVKLLAKFPPCFLMIELNPLWLEEVGTPCDTVKQQLDGAGYNTEAIDCGADVQTYTLLQRNLKECAVRCRGP